MLQSFAYAATTRILFGQGALAQTATELKALGCGHPMVVTDQGVGALGFFDRLKDSVGKAGLRYEVFDAVPQDPDLKDIDHLAGILKRKNSDSVVAVGGGSVLCAGRGAAVTLPSGVSARELVGIGKVVKGPLPMIAIPTTAGSGSEVSGVIVLSDRDNTAIVSL